MAYSVLHQYIEPIFLPILADYIPLVVDIWFEDVYFDKVMINYQVFKLEQWKLILNSLANNVFHCLCWYILIAKIDSIKFLLLHLLSVHHI